MKTISTFGNSPVPRAMVIRGIHAIGGMGRMNEKMAPKKASIFLFQPMSTPKAMPIVHANTSAITTLCRLAAMCAGKLTRIIGYSSNVTKRSYVTAGDGKSSGCIVLTLIHSPMRRIIDANGRILYITSSAVTF